MHKRILVPFFLCFILMKLVAQTYPTYQTAPLEAGDVEKFIRTYDPLTKDLKQLGQRMDEVKDISAMQAMAANKDVQAIFQKYGWEGDWMGKVMTIVSAYGVLQVEEQLAQLSAEERKQYETYAGAQMEQMRSSITEEDIEAVKSNLAELDQIFEQ